MPVSLPSASSLRAHVDAGQQPAASDVVGKFFDRDAGLGLAHVLLAEDELVGDISPDVERDFLEWPVP